MTAEPSRPDTPLSVDREQLRVVLARANAKALAEARAQIGLDLEFRGGFRLARWKWTVTVNGVAVATGTALTADRAKIRRYRAYLLVLDRVADRGGEPQC